MQTEDRIVRTASQKLGHTLTGGTLVSSRYSNQRVVMDPLNLDGLALAGVG